MPDSLKPPYKLNTILYGPPGTGKTYSTIKMAAEIIKGEKIDDYEECKRIFQVGRKEGQIEFVTFHQNYSYEDFIEGIKPTENDTELKFETRDGVLKRLIEGSQIKETFEQVYSIFQSWMSDKNKSLEMEIEIKERGRSKKPKKQKYTVKLESSRLQLHPQNSQGVQINTEDLKRLFSDGTSSQTTYKPIYEELVKLLKNLRFEVNQQTESVNKKIILIIDEINRANISRVFGELISLIEEDKRLGKKNELVIKLPVSGVQFGVPANLYIIGTMNTADKSIALLDVALRRRFTFVHMPPKPELVTDPAVKTLMETINQALFDDGKGADYLIGHAYFMDKKPEEMPDVMNNQVLPLLSEYYMNDVGAVYDLLKDKKEIFKNAEIELVEPKKNMGMLTVIEKTGTTTTDNRNTTSR